MTSRRGGSAGEPIRWGEFAAVLGLIAILAIVLTSALAYFGREDRANSCLQNFKTWAAAFSMYQSDWNEMLPPVEGRQTKSMGDYNGCANVDLGFDLAPSGTAMASNFNYGIRPDLYVCPLGDPDIGVAVDDGSGACAEVGKRTNWDAHYTYLGHFLFEPYIAGMEFPPWGHAEINADNAEAHDLLGGGRVESVTLLTYLARLAEGKIEAVDGDFTPMSALPETLRGAVAEAVDGLLDGDAPYSDSGIRRLRGRIENFLIANMEEPMQIRREALQARGTADLQPVMWDRITIDDEWNLSSAHGRDGINVLYLDGHVEFMPFDSAGPIHRTLRISGMTESEDTPDTVEVVMEMPPFPSKEIGALLMRLHERLDR